MWSSGKVRTVPKHLLTYYSAKTTCGRPIILPFPRQKRQADPFIGKYITSTLRTKETMFTQDIFKKANSPK